MPSCTPSLAHSLAHPFRHLQTLPWAVKYWSIAKSACSSQCQSCGVISMCPRYHGDRVNGQARRDRQKECLHGNHLSHHSGPCLKGGCLIEFWLREMVPEDHAGPLIICYQVNPQKRGRVSCKLSEVKSPPSMQKWDSDRNKNSQRGRHCSKWFYGNMFLILSATLRKNIIAPFHRRGNWGTEHSSKGGQVHIAGRKRMQTRCSGSRIGALRGNGLLNTPCQLPALPLHTFSRVLGSLP